LPGYFQPVEIKAPQGALVSLAVAGTFDGPKPAPRRTGFLIGQVYRMRVTNIHLHPGMEVFPTIEVTDRLYPPRGQETRFAIPIELTQEDLELALQGKFVTRVIYLEDPRRALPVAEDPQRQEWFEIGPGRGAMTGPLLEHCASLHAVEIDRDPPTIADFAGFQTSRINRSKATSSHSSSMVRQPPSGPRTMPHASRSC